jgi:HEAT repeat protein
MIASASPLLAGEKTEEQLIAELSSPDASKVANAMQDLEKRFPTSTNAFATMRKMLTDPREKVRRKAGRVLGVLHAEVNEQNIKDICTMLKAPSIDEQIDALKSLRGLKAPSAVPEILPMLKSPNLNVMRDACRTLAVLGNKDSIPAIEPLLKHPDTKVQKDAQDAIFALNSKS